MGGSLSLTPLSEADRAELTVAASDKEIWVSHPAQDRYLAPVFDAYFDFLMNTGSSLLVRDDQSGEVIGVSAFYVDNNAPSRLCIGFTFLVRSHWGGKTNFALKKLMLEHCFAMSSEVWFHIGPDNTRSQIATTRLGAVFTHEDEVDIGSGPQLWRCYCLTREAWAARSLV